MTPEYLCTTNQQEAVKMVFYIYLNFEQSISKGILKYPLHFYGMSCQNQSETVTRLTLLNRHTTTLYM
jgi:hypothetical protein